MVKIDRNALVKFTGTYAENHRLRIALKAILNQPYNQNVHTLIDLWLFPKEGESN